MARGLNQPASECQLLSFVVAASESPAQAELSVSESESESVTVAPEGPGVAVGLAAAAGSPPEAGRAMRLISVNFPRHQFQCLVAAGPVTCPG